MKIKSFRHNDGQLMIEILAGFVLMTFLLSGLVVAGLFALRNVQYSRNRSTATKLASEQLERVRVKRDVDGIDVLASCSGDCFLESDLSFGPTQAVGVIDVSLQIAGAGCPLPPGVTGTAYKAISTAKWDSSKPTPHQVRVEACFSDWNQ